MERNPRKTSNICTHCALRWANDAGASACKAGGADAPNSLSLSLGVLSEINQLRGCGNDNIKVLLFYLEPGRPCSKIILSRSSKALGF